MQEQAALSAQILQEPEQSVKVCFIGEQRFKGQRFEQAIKKKRNIQWVLDFIRKQYQVAANEGIVGSSEQFCFVADSFIPGQRETLHDLHQVACGQQKYKTLDGSLMIKFADIELFG